MKKLLFISLALSLLLASCKESGKAKSLKISSSGKSAELLVVANESVWKSAAGDSVFRVFSQDMPGLANSEPLFDVVNIPHHALSKMFQSHRNILMLETEKGLDSAIVEIRSDVWAQPQTHIRIRFPDHPALFTALGKYGNVLIEYYVEAEMRRILKAFRNVENVKIRAEIQQKLGFSLVFPTAYYIAKNEPDFMWIRQVTKDYNLEVFLHVFPYEDTAAFLPENVIKVRNRLGEQYVPGPTEGSFMGTEMLLTPDVRRFRLNGFYAAETRGWWKMMNHSSMGGPYLNYTLLDEARNRIIVLDGLVFYPNKDKRDLLRQLEGIFRSLEVKAIER